MAVSTACPMTPNSSSTAFLIIGLLASLAASPLEDIIAKLKGV
jgi:hypothetical protein